MKCVVLLSGGMDSSVALWQALAEGYEVLACLSVDYGSKHNARELPMAEWQARKAGVPFHQADLTVINELFTSDLLQSGGEIPLGHYEDESMRKTVVPFRNGILLSLAAGFAESLSADALIIAAHAGDHTIYPDCRESFLAPMAEAIAQGTYKGLQVMRPFVHQRKEDIAAIGHRLGVDFTHTWSCYQGRELHCGQCGTCVERKIAFALAQLSDPTVYAG